MTSPAPSPAAAPTAVRLHASSVWHRVARFERRDDGAVLIVTECGRSARWELWRRSATMTSGCQDCARKLRGDVREANATRVAGDAAAAATPAPVVRLVAPACAVADQVDDVEDRAAARARLLPIVEGYRRSRHEAEDLIGNWLNVLLSDGDHDAWTLAVAMIVRRCSRPRVGEQLWDLTAVEIDALARELADAFHVQPLTA